MTAIARLGAIVALCSLALPVSAATDYSGSYHSVAEKSSTSNGGPLPKNFSLTIDVKFVGNKIVYHSVNANAPAADLDYTAPLDGSVVPLTGNARFNQIAVKKIAPNQLEILEMKDGDVLVAAYWTFDRDGKGFVRRGIGKAADGKSHEYEEFYAKQ
jgi:hypothetical protein